MGRTPRLPLASLVTLVTVLSLAGPAHVAVADATVGDSTAATARDSAATARDSATVAPAPRRMADTVTVLPPVRVDEGRATPEPRGTATRERMTRGAIQRFLPPTAG